MEPETTEELVIPYSVKELLAKEALTKVPERYVRPDIDPPILSNKDSLPQLPVIDLNKLLAEEVKGPELEKLDLACKEWGFFQVGIYLHLHWLFVFLFDGMCIFLVLSFFLLFLFATIIVHLIVIISEMILYRK